MTLEFSVEAIVTAMMTWVMQVENGGFLNVLFEKVPNTPQESPQFDVATTIKYDFFTSMLLLRPLPLPILNAMPEALGGGQAGVDNAHKHPNREAILFWITVGLLLFFIVLIMCIQICTCCCCKSKYTTAPPTKSERKRLVFRIIFITLIVVELLLVLASMSFLVIYFCNVESTVSYLKAKPPASSELTHTPTSLPDGLRAVLMHTTDFFYEGIQSGRKHTDSLIKTFINQTKERLVSGVDKGIDDLLLRLRVQEMLNASNTVVSVYESFVLQAQDAIQNIDSARAGAGKITNKVKSSMQLIDKAIGSFAHCDDTPPCPEVKNATKKPIGPADLESLNTKVMEEIIQTLNSTILQLQTHVDQVQPAIDAIHYSTNNIISQLEEETNFDELFRSLANFWTDIDGQAGNIIHQMRLVTSSFEKQLEGASGIIEITLYCVGGCLTFIILIATIVNVCMIIQVTRNHIPSDPGDGSKGRRTGKTACGKCSICCCSMLLLPLLFIFGAVIAVSLFALTTASGEGCVYLTRETAINKTDFILNGFVAHNWKSLARSVNGDVVEFIIMTPPKNPLYALKKTCYTGTGNRGVGLLSALGYSNVVNTSRVVSSPAVAQGIAKGRETVLREMKRLNISGNLPDSTLITQTKTKLMEMAGNLKLTSYLDLLDTNLINTAEVIRLMDMLGALVGSNAVSNKGDFQAAIVSFGEVVDRMDEFKKLANNTRESISSTDKRLGNLISSFDIALTALLNSLSFGKNESALMTEVEKQYDALTMDLTNFLEVDVDGLFAQMTQDLLPCGKAHAAYTVAMEVTCGESGGVTRLLGLFSVLAFNIVFLVLLHLGIFSLFHLRTLQVGLLAGDAGGVGWSDEETSATTTTTGSSYND